MAEYDDEIRHRNHIIKAIPARDPDRRGWIAQFKAWKHGGGETQLKIEKDPELNIYEDKGEAIKHSISLGKFWVDREEGSL